MTSLWLSVVQLSRTLSTKLLPSNACILLLSTLACNLFFGGAVHKLCNAEGRTGVWPNVIISFFFIKVNEKFDQKSHMSGKGVKNGQFWH